MAGTSGAAAVVRWGIIGCGAVTEVKSGPAYRQVPGFALQAVMRRNAALAEDYARRHGVPRWTDDADAIIRADDIDAVYIATATGHAPALRAAGRRRRQAVLRREADGTHAGGMRPDECGLPRRRRAAVRRLLPAFAAAVRAGGRLAARRPDRPGASRALGLFAAAEARRSRGPQWLAHGSRAGRRRLLRRSRQPRPRPADASARRHRRRRRHGAQPAGPVSGRGRGRGPLALRAAGRWQPRAGQRVLEFRRGPAPRQRRDRRPRRDPAFLRLRRSAAGPGMRRCRGPSGSSPIRLTSSCRTSPVSPGTFGARRLTHRPALPPRAPPKSWRGSWARAEMAMVCHRPWPARRWCNSGLFAPDWCSRDREDRPALVESMACVAREAGTPLAMGEAFLTLPEFPRCPSNTSKN